jgi:hypothetical protein
MAMNLNALASAGNSAPQPVDLVSEFKQVSEEICALAARDGIRILPYQPYNSGVWARLRSLDERVQREKLQSLRDFHRICIEAVRSGKSLKDSAYLLSSTLASYGYSLCRGVTELLGDDDVIEVYTKDLTQLFRNLKFLEVCSYPLSDLYVYDWVELYRRPFTITDTLVKQTLDVLSKLPGETVRCEVPDHVLEEVFSTERRKFFIRQKILSPILDRNGQIVGVLGTLDATVIGSALGEFSGANFPGMNVTPLSG